MITQVLTLEQHILEGRPPGVSGDFTRLMTAVALSAKVISREVRRAGLTSVLGAAGSSNSHGEQQQKLDLLAHQLLINTLINSGHMCALASEEQQSLVELPDDASMGKYTVACDPLDGSSNIDYGVSVGTIFSIHKRVTAGGKGREEDLLQPGRRQVAAGYIIYGSSTLFVYSTGQGVHGFTLDPTIGEFIMSHPNIRTPARGRIYSVNEANIRHWSPALRSYIEGIRSASRPGGAATARYVGSLVADFHRNLLAGGIFLYPGDAKNPNGKLRLLYEAAPLAFLAEQAGGYASTGRGPILDVVPTGLHERVPLIIGSAEDVHLAEEMLLAEQRMPADTPTPRPAMASPMAGMVAAVSAAA